jgi:hypothetical protein
MRPLIFILVIPWIVSCSNSGSKKAGKNTLLFTIHQERDIYHHSDYGEPPQFAIWLENSITGEVKTVFVTNRTGLGNFEGKVECPVSLPAWIGAFRKETGRNDIPSIQKPVDMAITGATPKVPDFSAKIIVPADSRWNYYVELNVSGDYTPEFLSLFPDGTIDYQGNGQPSIIYRGEIKATAGEQTTPELIGRTEQLFLSSVINPDMKGIRNAKDVFSKITVMCTNGTRRPN